MVLRWELVYIHIISHYFILSVCATAAALLLRCRSSLRCWLGGFLKLLRWSLHWPGGSARRVGMARVGPASIAADVMLLLHNMACAYRVGFCEFILCCIVVRPRLCGLVYLRASFRTAISAQAISASRLYSLRLQWSCMPVVWCTPARRTEEVV